MNRQGAELGRFDDRQLAESSLELRKSLAAPVVHEEKLARSFALVRTIAERRMGQRPYDEQMLGARGLFLGNVVEMETGEGKTLTAAICAATAALAGLRVHVVTVNSYLARRDAETMGPIFHGLGIRVGLVEDGMDHDARREAYGSDVTYVTNKSLAFDYLRDRLTMNRRPSDARLRVGRIAGDARCGSGLLLRGLEFAIVDEADSVLIDEARTPLILSEPRATEEERADCKTALWLASRMSSGGDYRIGSADRRVEITTEGRRRIASTVSRTGLGGVWRSPRARDSLVSQALTASLLLRRDRHYVVRSGKVSIVDEFTGRTLPDRHWEGGLQQLVEAKEGCAASPRHEPVARFSYQRLFRRYVHLCGLTGTAREVRRELARVYRVGVVRVPPHRPVRRDRVGPEICSTSSEKWSRIVERVGQIHSEGRPVLVGTRSVEASELLSRLLAAADLPHRVLNARQDRSEAATIAQAGEPGRITVATNMAGRGTDIRLADGVAEAGGLHVLASELHEARRIDRQLMGRAARQGEPGSCEAILSLEDELLVACGFGLCRWLACFAARMPAPIGVRAGQLAFRWAQRRAERQDCDARRQLLRLEVLRESDLVFAGLPE